MKQLIYIGLSIAAVLGLSTACSQELLDIPQKGVVSYEDFYQTDEDAESAVLSVYEQGQYTVNMGSGFTAGWCIAPPYFVLTNAPSDDSYYGSGSPGDHVFGLEINEYRPSFGSTNSVVQNLYLGMYQLIYKANLVIDNFEPGSSSIKDRCIAEARVFRAWAHFFLATYWGTPPLIDHVLVGNEHPENTDHKVLMDWIINEYKEVAEELPSRNGPGDKAGAYRLTKEAVYAFLGKAQVFAGDYAGAKTSLKKVIDSGNYSLVPGSEMENMFHRAGDGNSEKIFEFNYIDNVNLPRMAGVRHFQRNQSCWWRDLKSLPDKTIGVIGWGGGGNPSLSFVKAIMENEPDSYRRKAWLISYEELIADFSYGGDTMTREERLMDPLRGLSAPKYYGNCGWFLYKYAPYRSDTITNSTDATDSNTHVMRYAEVLLLYAEACAQTGDNDGLKYLNMIAERAGAPTYTSLTMDNVKKEKRFELYMEGTRFADLVRWGDAASVLKDQGKCVPSFTDPFVEGSVPHSAVIDYSDAYYNTEYGFKTGKNELMPFPFNELNINENLVQNPGWD